ncbi:hypothetical protein C6P45_001555 [Maudiozyma exigua]|uniref:Flo11 domain-containing protein n=1 Tax=Maudiozyma exigua TaxID=34358 RepID=A0A9P6VZR8_MAUEX|nr:hypothetical protein C6P45_001555 [Kazachstania exigua]
MIKLLSLKNLLFVVSILSVCSASFQTKNLGQLNLLPGFAVKLYTSSLRGPDDYHRRPLYFTEKDFLKDSQLIAQEVYSTGMNTCWNPYEWNYLFEFLVDPTLRDFVVEMRGYIKSPLNGNLSFSTSFYSLYDCNYNLAHVFEAGYWVIKDTVSLNDTSEGFICSYNSSNKNYKALTFEGSCNNDTCGRDNPPFTPLATAVKDQYYPVTFYTYISGNNFYTEWGLMFNGGYLGYFDNFAYYDPNDDFTANDESLDSNFPDACPHFHDEVFTATSFVEMNTRDNDECPKPTSLSSIIRPSSSLTPPPPTASAVHSSLSELSYSGTASLSGSDASIITGLSESRSAAPSGSITSRSKSKISSANPSNSISSVVSSNSTNKYQSSGSHNNPASSTESKSVAVNGSSQLTKTTSNSDSEITSFSNSLPRTSLASASSSTNGKPIYTANSTISNSQQDMLTSESIDLISSSSATSESSYGSDIVSTAIVTKSKIDTSTSTTCPDADNFSSTVAANPSLSIAKPQTDLTRINGAVLSSRNYVAAEVIKTTTRPDGVTVTYTECASGSILQENNIVTSEDNSRSYRETPINAVQSYSMGTTSMKENLLASGAQPTYSNNSTVVTVQVLPDDGQFLKYEPLLLGISILMSFL